MHTPSNPNFAAALPSQCVICGTALSGPLSHVFRLAGISRSTRNPDICTRCNAHIEEGRIVELSVLFADLSRFTELTNELGPERIHEIVTAFLDMATDALVRQGAFIDKYIGDAVMAFFNMPIRQEDHAARAVAAAVEIQDGFADLRERFGLDLDSAIGIATGWARVGSLGSGLRKDYTAIGDVVNLASRLEGQAYPGEILVQDRVYEKIADDFPDACPEMFTLKGFRQPVMGFRLVECANKAGWEHIKRLRYPAPGMSLGLVLFALLGAPCMAGSLIGPLAVGLGIGTMFGAMATYWSIFDKPFLQYPLFALAILGSLANLYILWRAHELHKEGKDGIIAMTSLERRRTLLVAGSSIITFLMVAYELYLHTTMRAAQ